MQGSVTRALNATSLAKLTKEKNEIGKGASKRRKCVSWQHKSNVQKKTRPRERFEV